MIKNFGDTLHILCTVLKESVYLYLGLDDSGRGDCLFLISSPGCLGSVVGGLGAMNSNLNRTLTVDDATHQDLNEIPATPNKILNQYKVNYFIPARNAAV